MPEQLSHSLGKLVRSKFWQIGTEPVEMQWTVKLFKMLLDKDLEKKSLKTS
jgi:hypothetical protein